MKDESAKSDDPEVLRKYKLLRNSIKARLPAEELNYYASNFRHEDITIKEVWSSAYEILDQNKDLSPKQLYVGDERISSPQKLADAFNNIFLNKVKQLKNKLSDNASVEPSARLR